MASEHQFVSADTEKIISGLISIYEELTGRTVNPADPERLFILYIANLYTLLCARINYTGNQNIPSRADGENLDGLSELYYNQERPGAKASTCTVRFRISQAQASAIRVPAGTRVTTNSDKIYWATQADGYIPIGDAYIDLPVYCQETGTDGNGYAAGQINKLVDVFPYSSGCENLTSSDGGSNVPTDKEYYDLLRASQDAFSVAGPLGAYIYWAKTVSTEIADVKPTSPEPGYVNIYILMDNGEIASDTIKDLVLKTCNDDEIRPLTDFVSVEDPEETGYNIDLTYYMLNGSSQSGDKIAQAVEESVSIYINWQSGKLGRDINPTELISLVKGIEGVKRVELREPAFTVLHDGEKDASGSYTVPQIARLGELSIINGGYEDE